MKSQIPSNIIERADFLVKSNIGFMNFEKAKIVCNESGGHYNNSDWVLCPDTTVDFKVTKKAKIYFENLRKNYKPDYFHFSYAIDLNIGRYYLRFDIDTLGKYIHQSEIELPDTLNSNILYELKIDSLKALNIAKTIGFIDGIKPWTFSLKVLNKRFYWEIRNTDIIEKGLGVEGDGIFIDAITGEVDKTFQWISRPVY